MGKRSAFPRIPKDLYRTFDQRAVPPLLAHLPSRVRYVEPCAGHGDLIDQLATAAMTCAGAYDIAPGREDIAEADALGISGPCSLGPASLLPRICSAKTRLADTRAALSRWPKRPFWIGGQHERASPP